MSAEPRVTSFQYGRDKLILMFCPRCLTGPIIMTKKVYEQVSANQVQGALLCKQCSRRSK